MHDGRMHYLYNVGDEGPTSLRISSPADASTRPPPAFAPFSHPIQNYLSDGGVSPAPHQPAAAADAAADAGPGGFYVFDDAEATGYGEETPRRRGGDDDDDDSADEQEEVHDDEVDYEVDDEDEED